MDEHDLLARTTRSMAKRLRHVGLSNAGLSDQQDVLVRIHPILSAKVVALLAQVYIDDPEDYSRYLFEMKAAGIGLLNDVKKAVQEHRKSAKIEASREEMEDEPRGHP